MITTDQARIDELTASGHWSADITLHGLLSRHALEQPLRLAVKDQPNRLELTGDKPVLLTGRSSITPVKIWRLHLRPPEWGPMIGSLCSFPISPNC